MSKFWTLIVHLHSLAGPVLMLLYPLYASVIAIETTSKVDDEQWLAYWIIYSFLTLTEMLIQPILAWIPIWYTVKLVLVAWLVLPQLRGAAFLYERLVRQHIRKYRSGRVDAAAASVTDQPTKKTKSPNIGNGNAKGKGKGKGKTKFVEFVSPKKGEQEAY